jgi:hypothetical protein
MKTLLSLLCLLTCLYSCQHEPNQMVLPDELALVNLQENDSVCHTCTHQVVVFHDFDQVSFLPFSRTFPWADYKKKFPQVGFLFYFSGSDKEKLIRELEKLEFPFPGYHDPDFQFYKLNQLDTVNTTYKVLHSFHLTHGKAVKHAQIGMGPLFVEELEKILNTE